MTVLEAVKGDITKLDVDVVVNAANSSLLGGGGVDGAIHRAAGKELVFECRLLGGCKTGEAKLTKGYNLPASHIIHTVGPVWQGGKNNESELLVSCYQQSLLLASNLMVRSIAFPCISTGIYHFPQLLAAQLAITTVKKFLKERPTSFEQLIFCCYSEDDYQRYLTLLNEMDERG